MPQPARRDVHVDGPLSNISVAYIQSATNFIAGQVFPNIPVTKQSDLYYVYTKADWFTDQAEMRGDSEESAGSGYRLSTSSYSCDVWALHKDIGDQTRANADPMINNERDAALFIAQKLMLRREIQWQTDFFTSTPWDNSVTGGTDFTKWSVAGSSDPTTDIETGKSTILQNTGFEPNTLVLGYNAFRYLKHHPDLVDRFKYTSSQTLTEDLLAGVFGVDRVLVAKAIKNTANEMATASMAFVQTGADALLCYSNPTPSLMQPSAGYTFVWTGVSDGMGIEVGTRSFNIPRLGRNHMRVESEIAFDCVAVASDLGYYFTTAV